MVVLVLSEDSRAAGGRDPLGLVMAELFLVLFVWGLTPSAFLLSKLLAAGLALAEPQGC